MLNAARFVGALFTLSLVVCALTPLAYGDNPLRAWRFVLGGALVATAAMSAILGILYLVGLLWGMPAADTLFPTS